MKEITIYIILLSIIAIHADESGDTLVAGTCYLTGRKEYDSNDFVGVLDFDFDFEDYTINITGSLHLGGNGDYNLTLHQVFYI